MPEEVIRVVGSEYGTYPDLNEMNPAFQPGARTLKLTLEIDWRPEDPAADLSRLQDRLVALSPSLRRHQCRGPHQYRLLRPPSGAGIPGGGAAAAIEPSLALAHLAEHLLIDIFAHVAEVARVSGATGAWRDSTNRFDIFVECPDPALARLGTHLAVRWILSSNSDRTGFGRRRLLDLGQLLFALRPRAVCAEQVAAALDADPRELDGDFVLLESAGFLCRVDATMNLSGSRYYRVPG